MTLNWNFQRGGEVLSFGEVWIFSGKFYVTVHNAFANNFLKDYNFCYPVNVNFFTAA